MTPRLCQHLMLSAFLILAFLAGVYLCVLIVLMCSSLMTYDVEHLFIRLCDICVSSLVRCLSRSAAHFLIGLFTFSLLSFKNSLYILRIRRFLQISSSSLWLAFLFSSE